MSDTSSNHRADSGAVGAASAFEVLDWRRQVGRLYADVREAADPAAGHARWVRGRDRLLREHPASPVPSSRRASYPGAEIAPYDAAYRFVVPVATCEPARLELPTGEGATVFHRLGRIALAGLGELDVWWLTSYGGGIFVPFRDTDPTTYGGGRYVLDTVKGADLGGSLHALVVDLNFAYQPSCAYDVAWSCPLPGPGNTLNAAVGVGEHDRPL